MPHSLETAKRMLEIWLEAEVQLAEGAQSYTIGNRSLTRANGDLIAKRIAYWQSQVDALEGGGGLRIRRVVHRDS